MWKNVLGRTDRPEEGPSKRNDETKPKDDSRPKRKDSMKDVDKSRKDTEAVASPSTRKAPRGDDRGIEDEKKPRRRDRSTSRDRKPGRRDRSRSEERVKDDKERKLKRRSTDTGIFSGETSRSQTSRALDDATRSERPISNHVPDMFPGQFPSGVSAPYRPPLSLNEGGPGLASDYYNDGGQSVGNQPGVRPDAPEVIMNAQPHLMTAGASAAPPSEPSSLGQVGAAASFFGQSTPSSSNSASRPPPQSSTGSVLPVLGAAAGYALSTSNTGQSTSYQTGSYQSRPNDSFNQSAYDASSRPQQPGRQSSSNRPYTAAAVAAGAAGLAAGAYYNQHHQHDNNAVISGTGHASNDFSATTVKQNRRSGPLDKVIDFFKDPEGVARFEEYSEISGICRGCFEPGTSARQAPRRHNMKHRRSNDKMRSSRVDKENRYYGSSDGESRRKSNKSFLGAAAAGLGLAAVGRTLAGDFDDTYSVKSGKYQDSRQAPRRSSQEYQRKSYSDKDERRSRKSEKKVEYGIAEDGAVFRKSKAGTGSTDNMITVERRRSDSDSDDNKKLRKAAIGVAAGAALAAASTRQTSSGEAIRVRRRSRSRSSERKSRRRQSPVQSPSLFGRFFSSPPSDGRRKKSRGFFNFSNGSSSSDSSLIFEAPEKDTRRKNKRSSPRIQTAAEANAALIGLGTAAAALAAHESRNKKSTRPAPSLVAVKTNKAKDDRRYATAEDGWESASESDSSADSNLAFGSPLNRSRENLAENGTDKWNWRWGQSKRRSSSPRIGDARHDSGVTGSAAAGLAGMAAGAAAGAMLSGRKDEYYSQPSRDEASNSTRPLQYDSFPSSDSRRYANKNRDPIIEQEPHQAYRATVPIQQPQPFVPVPDSVYRRRDSDGAPSMQPKSPRNREDGVRFDFTREQEERYRNRDHKDASDYNDVDFELIEPGRKRPSFENREIKSDELDEDQLKEVQAELARLRAYRNLKKEQQAAGNNKASFALAGMAAIAVAAEAKKNRAEKDQAEQGSKASEKKSSKGFANLVSALASSSKTQSALNKSDASPADQQKKDEIVREIVSRATAKVGNVRAPSPVHESYASYFAPDILSKKPDAKQTNPDPNADVEIGIAGDALSVGTRGRMSEPEFPKIEDEQFDPVEWHKSLPWRVPSLGLINPTPPVSRAGSRNPSAQPSPMIKPSEPSIVEEDEEHADGSEKSDKRVDEDFTDIVPKSPHEKKSASKSPITLKRVDQPAANNSPKDSTSPIEDVKRTPMPGQFEDDIDFAATLAAGAEAAGFDPSIVVDDPTYRRRDSPPGSHSQNFYQQPYYQTVSDVGFQSANRAGVPVQRGFVEGEVPDTPKEGTPTEIESSKKSTKVSRKEQRKKDKASKRFQPDDEIGEDAETTSPFKSVGGDRVRDNTELEIIEDMARDTQTEPDTPGPYEDKKQSKRENTSGFASTAFAAFGGVAAAKAANDVSESKSQPKDKTPMKPRGVDFASIILAAARREAAESQEANSATKPDDAKSDVPRSREIETASTSATTSVKAEARDASVPTDLKNQRDEDANDVYDSPNEYAPSAYAASAVGNGDEDESRKHKRKSKRRSKTFDDSPDIVSSTKHDDEIELTRDQTKVKEKKGGIFGLFGKSTSNESSEKQSSKEAASEVVESNDEPKRKKKSRKSKDNSDFYSIASTSAGDLTKLDDEEDDRKSRRRRSRRDTTEDDFSEKDLQGPNDLYKPNETHKRASEQSFLEERREKPKPPDIDTAYNDSDEVDSGSFRRSSSSPPDHRPSTPPKIDWIRDDAFTPEGVEARPRRLSLVQGSGYGSPATPSPTAIPLVFRKPPSSAVTKPSSAASSPSLQTPKSRKARPSSVEFRSNEFRPLWLVTQYQPKQEIDPEEVFPSLPSSHSNSRSSSVHEDEFRAREMLSGKAIDNPSDTAFTPADILDSGQTTPTAVSYRAKREQDLLDEARQEAVAREIEWNLRNSPESKRRSQELQDRSPSLLARDVLATAGVATIAGGAAALALNSKENSPKASNVSEQADHGLPHMVNDGMHAKELGAGKFLDNPASLSDDLTDDPHEKIPDDMDLGAVDGNATPTAETFAVDRTNEASHVHDVVQWEATRSHMELHPIGQDTERVSQDHTEEHKDSEATRSMSTTESLGPSDPSEREDRDVVIPHPASAPATQPTIDDAPQNSETPKQIQTSNLENSVTPVEYRAKEDTTETPSIDDDFFVKPSSKKDKKKAKKSRNSGVDLLPFETTESDPVENQGKDLVTPDAPASIPLEDDVEWATPTKKKGKKGKKQAAPVEIQESKPVEVSGHEELPESHDDKSISESVPYEDTERQPVSDNSAEAMQIVAASITDDIEPDEWTFTKKSKKKGKKSKVGSTIAGTAAAAVLAASNDAAQEDPEISFPTHTEDVRSTSPEKSNDVVDDGWDSSWTNKQSKKERKAKRELALTESLRLDTRSVAPIEDDPEPEDEVTNAKSQKSKKRKSVTFHDDPVSMEHYANLEYHDAVDNESFEKDILDNNEPDLRDEVDHDRGREHLASATESITSEKHDDEPGPPVILMDPIDDHPDRIGHVLSPHESIGLSSDDHNVIDRGIFNEPAQIEEPSQALEPGEVEQSSTHSTVETLDGPIVHSGPSEEVINEDTEQIDERDFSPRLSSFSQGLQETEDFPVISTDHGGITNVESELTADTDTARGLHDLSPVELSKNEDVAPVELDESFVPIKKGKKKDKKKKRQTFTWADDADEESKVASGNELEGNVNTNEPTPLHTDAFENNLPSLELHGDDQKDDFAHDYSTEKSVPQRLSEDSNVFAAGEHDTVDTADPELTPTPLIDARSNPSLDATEATTRIDIPYHEAPSAVITVEPEWQPTSKKGKKKDKKSRKSFDWDEESMPSLSDQRQDADLVDIPVIDTAASVEPPTPHESSYQDDYQDAAPRVIAENNGKQSESLADEEVWAVPSKKSKKKDKKKRQVLTWDDNEDNNDARPASLDEVNSDPVDASKEVTMELDELDSRQDPPSVAALAAASSDGIIAATTESQRDQPTLDEWSVPSKKAKKKDKKKRQMSAFDDTMEPKFDDAANDNQVPLTESRDERVYAEKINDTNDADKATDEEHIVGVDHQSLEDEKIKVPETAELQSQTTFDEPEVFDAENTQLTSQDAEIDSWTPKKKKKKNASKKSSDNWIPEEPEESKITDDKDGPPRPVTYNTGVISWPSKEIESVADRENLIASPEQIADPLEQGHLDRSATPEQPFFKESHMAYHDTDHESLEPRELQRDHHDNHAELEFAATALAAAGIAATHLSQDDFPAEKHSNDLNVEQRAFPLEPSDGDKDLNATSERFDGIDDGAVEAQHEYVHDTRAQGYDYQYNEDDQQSLTRDQEVNDAGDVWNAPTSKKKKKKSKSKSKAVDSESDGFRSGALEAEEDYMRDKQDQDLQRSYDEDYSTLPLQQKEASIADDTWASPKSKKKQKKSKAISLGSDEIQANQAADGLVAAEEIMERPSIHDDEMPESVANMSAPAPVDDIWEAPIKKKSKKKSKAVISEADHLQADTYTTTIAPIAMHDDMEQLSRDHVSQPELTESKSDTAIRDDAADESFSGRGEGRFEDMEPEVYDPPLDPDTLQGNVIHDELDQGKFHSAKDLGSITERPDNRVRDEVWNTPVKKKSKKGKSSSSRYGDVSEASEHVDPVIESVERDRDYVDSPVKVEPAIGKPEVSIEDDDWNVPSKKKKSKKSKQMSTLTFEDEAVPVPSLTNTAEDDSSRREFDNPLSRVESLPSHEDLVSTTEADEREMHVSDPVKKPYLSHEERETPELAYRTGDGHPANDATDHERHQRGRISQHHDTSENVNREVTESSESSKSQGYHHGSGLDKNRKGSEFADTLQTASKVGAGIAMFEGIQRATSKLEDRPSKKTRSSEQAVDYHSTAFEDPTEHIQTKSLSEIHPAYRDSGLHMDSPDIASVRDSVRDSGFQDEPLHSFDVSVEVDPRYEVTISSPKNVHTTINQLAEEPDLPSVKGRLSGHEYHREPSPIDATTRERSATLFSSSPSTRNEFTHGRAQSFDDQMPPSNKSIFGGPIGHSSDRALDQLKSPPLTPTGHPASSQPLTTITETSPEEHRDTPESNRLSAIKRRSGLRRVKSPNNDSPRRLGLISTDDLLSKLSWPEVDDDQRSVDLERSISRNSEKEPSQRSTIKRKPLSVNLDGIRSHDRRSVSMESNESINAIIRSPPPLATPPLRRIDRSLSSELRSARTKSQAFSPTTENDAKPDLIEENNTRDLDEGIASSSTYDPTKDKGKGRLAKMADVYEGYGDMAGSPHSPTRPNSVRRRQSLQVLDLEARLDQLLSENRLLLDAKNRAERNLELTHQDTEQHSQALQEAIQTRDQYLQQKDEELSSLREKLQGLQDRVTHFGEANRSIQGEDGDVPSNYRELEADHAANREQLAAQSEELEELRAKHASLSGGMEAIVANEVRLALQNKDAEWEQLRSELQEAKMEVVSLKSQINSLKDDILKGQRGDEHLIDLEEDYFEEKCEELCKHVQSFVLRYSKFSDMRICRRMDEVQDEGITDRFDNAILDGTDADIYLADRIKRRDVFMSVVMSIMWNYIFTRYLFGMDREQRSKLKSLEKTLTEVGLRSAVNKWRATTLTMLSKREAFAAQREQDIEAVVAEILRTLAAFLPPPPNLRDSITDSLRKVVSSAVDLSIEMRTQKAEYIMLPPLQPEFNLQGDLETMVYFNAASMRERSGQYQDSEALEEEQAVVRIVLFPLVIKQEEGNEQEIIYHAQALVAGDDTDAKSTDRRTGQVMGSQGINRSAHSFAPSGMGEGGMF